MNKITEFIKLFEEYNTHTNLMSKNDIQKLKEKHIPDCLAIEKFFEKYNEQKNIIDIGTGGGLPSIPISIKYPNINVYAIDSIAKKIKFIEEVKEKLNIENLIPICSRIEDFEKKEFFDIATTRALATLSVILEYCAPYVKKDGYIVAYKSKTADEELKNAKNAIKILGLKFIEKIDIDTENNDIERYLLIFQKISQTPKKYPRKNNLARKNPL